MIGRHTAVQPLTRQVHKSLVFSAPQAQLMALDDRFGSSAEVQPRSRERLLPEVKRTYFAKKRTWSLNVCCWGQSGRTGDVAG